MSDPGDMSNPEDTSSPPKPTKWGTCADLRLNLEEALAGKTWKLLPEGFRGQECGPTYPLPNRREELQKLVAIPIPLRQNNSGVIYLRRANEAWRRAIRKKQAKQRVNLEEKRRVDEIGMQTREFKKDINAALLEANIAVRQVHREAQAAIASLTDLFSLGRRGIEGQMRAHLEGKDWQGEAITASAFRECFRLVAQAVKGLGLPSDQRRPAQDAIMREAAEAIRATQDAVSMAPGPPEDTEQ